MISGRYLNFEYGGALGVLGIPLWVRWISKVRSLDGVDKIISK